MGEIKYSTFINIYDHVQLRCMPYRPVHFTISECSLLNFAQILGMIDG